MKINPVKGTADYLPNEALIRDYLQSTILETYRSCGFERISTPIIEDIENLDKSEGGENLNLIFKIMKRGEKLDEAIACGNAKELADMGLRYDLTLPLTRYYANNRAKLQSPFKAIQIDKVYRAERPQKGRMREFVQCDIDIIGSDSWVSEVELITTTAKALQNIGFKKFGIRINDRQLLKTIIMSAGFTEDDCDSVCISLDKLDKIAADGVKAELLEKGFDSAKVEKLICTLNVTPFTLENAEELCGKLECIDRLRKIMDTVRSVANGYDVTYDMTLVRGQGYYTGTVFEITSPDFRGAIGGGGRYDNLIGKFLGERIPAVGFSIGFERICAILLEQKYVIPTMKKKLAVIYTEESFTDALRHAEELRAEYDVAMYESVKKLGKLFSKLEEAGFCGCKIEGQDEIKFFER